MSCKNFVTFNNGYTDGCRAYPKNSAMNEQVEAKFDLPAHKSSKCWVLETKNYCILQSYATIVSVYDKETGRLVEEKYSTTTSKQQCWFRRYLEGHYALGIKHYCRDGKIVA